MKLKVKQGDVVALADGQKVTVERVDGDRMDIVWFEEFRLKRANVPTKAARKP